MTTATPTITPTTPTTPTPNKPDTDWDVTYQPGQKPKIIPDPQN